MPGLNWCQLINFWCHLINIWGHVLLTTSWEGTNKSNWNGGPRGNRHKRQVESCRPDFKGDSGQFKFSIPNVVLVTSRFLIFFKCSPFPKCCEERAQKHKLRREQNVPRDSSSLLPFHLAFSDTWWLLDRLDNCGLRMQYFLITWKGWSSRRTSGSTPYTWRPG